MISKHCPHPLLQTASGKYAAFSDLRRFQMKDFTSTAWRYRSDAAVYNRLGIYSEWKGPTCTPRTGPGGGRSSIPYAPQGLKRTKIRSIAKKLILFFYSVSVQFSFTSYLHVLLNWINWGLFITCGSLCSAYAAFRPRLQNGNIKNNTLYSGVAVLVAVTSGANLVVPQKCDDHSHSANYVLSKKLTSFLPTLISFKRYHLDAA